MMARGSTFLAALGAVAIAAAPALAGDGVKFFYANFNGDAVDAPVPTGNPQFGYPSEIEGLDAVVRTGPFGSPSLELTDLGAEPGWTKFQFVEGYEARDGIVTFRVKFWFEEHENFGVYLRPADSLMGPFLNLRYHEDGTVTFGDVAAGNVIGTYQAGVEQRLQVIYRLDAQEYDVYLTGAAALLARPCNPGNYGLGSVYFAMERDEEFGSRVYIDDIDIFGNGVTPTEDSTWTELKDAFGR